MLISLTISLTNSISRSQTQSAILRVESSGKMHLINSDLNLNVAVHHSIDLFQLLAKSSISAAGSLFNGADELKWNSHAHFLRLIHACSGNGTFIGRSSVSFAVMNVDFYLYQISAEIDRHSRGRKKRSSKRSLSDHWRLYLSVFIFGTCTSRDEITSNTTINKEWCVRRRTRQRRKQTMWDKIKIFMSMENSSRNHWTESNASDIHGFDDGLGGHSSVSLPSLSSSGPDVELEWPSSCCPRELWVLIWNHTRAWEENQPVKMIAYLLHFFHFGIEKGFDDDFTDILSIHQFAHCIVDL